MMGGSFVKRAQMFNSIYIYSYMLLLEFAWAETSNFLIWDSQGTFENGDLDHLENLACFSLLSVTQSE